MTPTVDGMLYVALVLGFFAALALGCALGVSLLLLEAIRTNLRQFSESTGETLQALQALRSEMNQATSRAEVWRRQRSERQQARQAEEDGKARPAWQDDWAGEDG